MAEPFGQILRDIPNWLLMHISQPVGQRLPKLQKWHENLQHLARPHHSYDVPAADIRVPPAKHAPKSSVVKGYKHMGIGNWKTGSLSENEYPYWIGESPSTGTWARCRWCGESQPNSTRVSREAHQSLDYCTKNLRIVYKLACSSAMCCVMCERHSLRTRWGAPLCSIECDNAFRFKILLSPRLQKLREMAKDTGLLYPMGDKERETRAFSQPTCLR